MKYRWTICPGCDGEMAINYSESSAAVTGSVRRWSHDRTINDGRSFRISKSEASALGAFSVECPCGQTIEVPARPDAVSAEREEDLRVKLGNS